MRATAGCSALVPLSSKGASAGQRGSIPSRLACRLRSMIVVFATFNWTWREDNVVLSSSGE